MGSRDDKKDKWKGSNAWKNAQGFTEALGL